MRTWLTLLLIVACSALGFGLGWYAALSPLSPAGLLNLASQISDERAQQAKDRYEALQENLQKQQEQSRRELREAQKDREKVSRRLKETSRHLQAQRGKSEKRIQELQERAAAAETVMVESQAALAQALENECPGLSEEHEASRRANAEFIASLRGELKERSQVISFQDALIDSKKAMISNLAKENAALVRNLAIAERRYGEAENRIGQLSGRRIRVGPGVVMGAVRGVNGGWAPGVAVGLAVTW